MSELLNLVNYDEFLFEDVLEDNEELNEAGLRRTATQKKQATEASIIVRAAMKDPKVKALTDKYLTVVKKVLVQKAKEEGINLKYLKSIKNISLNLHKAA